MHTFQGCVRVSCGAIRVKSYVLKVSTIREVGLELVASSDHCGCPRGLLETTHISNKDQWEHKISFSRTKIPMDNLCISVLSNIGKMTRSAE